MLHVRGVTLDGINGVDVVRTFRDSFGMGIAATEYGAAYYGNGAHTDKAVLFPGVLTPQNRAILEQKINEKTGPRNAGKMLVLDGGMTIDELSSDPGKASLNDVRKFQADEYARIFGVPAHLIGQLDRATFNNIETMNTQFVTLCLNPWAEQVEQEFAVKLLTENEKTADRFFFRFNLDGLMRGDTAARATYVDTMLKNMVYTINDVRQLDNLNTVPWGDTPYAQAGITQLSEDGTLEIPEPQTDTPADAADNSQSNDTGTGTPQASAATD
jgi:HK97 family phage portal protein